MGPDAGNNFLRRGGSLLLKTLQVWPVKQEILDFSLAAKLNPETLACPVIARSPKGHPIKFTRQKDPAPANLIGQIIVIGIPVKMPCSIFGLAVGGANPKCHGTFPTSFQNNIVIWNTGRGSGLVRIGIGQSGVGWADFKNSGNHARPIGRHLF